MSAQPDATVLAAPAPEFAVVGAQHAPHAATPTMVFTIAATAPEAPEIYTIALSTQIHIEPGRRAYDVETRARLRELFGPTGRSSQNLVWARVEALVPSFLGEATFEVHVPCSFDLEVATTKYFEALGDGEVPLKFLFSGTVFYRGPDGALQLVQIPWDAVAEFRMALDRWRAMIDEHYPAGGWIRLHNDTLSALNAVRSERGLHTLDACVASLLEGHDAR